MNADDHKDVSMWIGWFNEHGVFMSNVVLEQIAKDIELEQIARKLTESKDENE